MRFAFLERQLVLCLVGVHAGAMVFCIRTEYLREDGLAAADRGAWCCCSWC